jgi:murein DD-endopeptidase MepM/ murein hydrolase activator NlpD
MMSVKVTFDRLTETNGIQASPFKGNHQKIFPDFKLGPFKAESIQNRSTERLRPELVEGSRRSPKSKIQNYTGFAGYPLPSGATVALSYGWHQSLTTGKPTFHSGIDLLANPGTPVLSVEDGTVAFAGLQGNYGNLVVVNHQGGRQTRYAHLESVSVTTRQKVKTGDTLGTVGSTGRRDTDKPHLHFEVRYNSPQGWVAQDPEPNLKAKPTANSSKS